MLVLFEAIAVWLAIVLVTMVAVTYLALRWGRDPFGWLLLSAVMGPIALVALVGTRQSDIDRSRSAGTRTGTRGAHTRCVVLASDGSSASADLARYVAALPDGSPEVIVLTVLPHEAEPPSTAVPDPEYKRRVAKLTKPAIEVLRNAGLAARVSVAFGAPGEEIVRYADGEPADLVVVGRRGAGLARSLLGSTSEYVVKNSRRPVTVIG